jgi:ribose 5-phosphate isomerase B
MNKERVFIASDHAAFKEKQTLIAELKDQFEIVDLGTHSEESTHYPIYARELALKVKEENARGILLCGSGIGVSIAANRFKGVRAALCRDEFDAEMSRRHNDANVICLGSRTTSIDKMKTMIHKFFSTSFEGGRHQIRVELMDR